MALEISTVGASVKYAFESTAGTRPTSGFSVLPNVSSAPSFDMVPEALDCSDITDTVTRYLKGRQDPGGDLVFTLNHTEAVITAWESLITNYATNYAAGKDLWFEYCYPGATKSYFFKGEPLALGNSGIEQNAVSTINAHVIFHGVEGWAAASTT